MVDYTPEGLPRLHRTVIEEMIQYFNERREGGLTEIYETEIQKMWEENPEVVRFVRELSEHCGHNRVERTLITQTGILMYVALRNQAIKNSVEYLTPDDF